jgi:hypothetical protein
MAGPNPEFDGAMFLLHNVVPVSQPGRLPGGATRQRSAALHALYARLVFRYGLHRGFEDTPIDSCLHVRTCIVREDRRHHRLRPPGPLGDQHSTLGVCGRHRTGDTARNRRNSRRRRLHCASRSLCFGLVQEMKYYQEDGRNTSQKILVAVRARSRSGIRPRIP